MGSKPRFFVRYRTLPLLAMAIVMVASLGLSSLPASLTSTFIYPVQHAQEINTSAKRHGVDPYLAAAVIKCESNWDEGAHSGVGATGLMQLMPSTAHFLADQGLVNTATYKPSNLTDPATNIEYGCAYLGYLQKELHSREAVIAAYNAGIGKVRTWLSGGNKTVSDAVAYPETKLYLRRVSDAYNRYKELYPQGLSNS